MQEVVNASDIRICLPLNTETEELTPVAHLYNGSLTIQARFVSVVDGIATIEDSDEAIWESDIVSSMSWSISGSSYLVLHPGHSFRTLLRLMISLEKIPVLFKIDDSDEDYKGDVRIRSLRKTGNTEDNTEVSFDLKGQGKFKEAT